MSLVNDVLRDLDERRELPVRGLPFPEINSSKDTGTQRPYQGLLLFAISILVVTLSIQVFYNKPLSKIFSSNSSLNSVSNTPVEFEHDDKLLKPEAAPRVDDTLALMIPLIEKELTETKEITTLKDTETQFPGAALSKIAVLQKIDTFQKITGPPVP